MRFKAAFAAAVFFLTGFPGGVRADQYVIVSPSVAGAGTKLDLNEVRDIFLGLKQFWRENQRIYPVCSNLSSQPLAQFVRQILKMEPDQYSSYWRRKLFSGKGHPPKEFSDDGQVLGFLRSNPSSIGVLEGRGVEPRALEGMAIYRIDQAGHQLVPTSVGPKGIL